MAEIAQRAGLTARTFFRHFADKREVLFARSGELQEHLVAALAAAPDSASPMTAIAAALADGLRRRGVGEPDASLAAETGIVVLKVAFERWLSGPPGADLAQAMREALDRLQNVTAAR